MAQSRFKRQQIGQASTERKMNQASDSVSCRRPVLGGGALSARFPQKNNSVSLYPLTALALAACGGSPPYPPFNRRPLPPTPTEDGNAPVLEVTGAQTLTLEEGTIGVVGTADTPTGYTVSATDDDGDDVTFVVDDTRFTIAADGSLNIVAGSIFDFEDSDNLNGIITLTITATDNSPEELTDTQDVTITVANVATAPVLTVSGESTLGEGAIGEDTPTGYTVTATDEDGNAITFSVDDDRFAVVNGELVAVADSIFDFETEETITLTITATDDSTDTLTDTRTVDVTVTDLVDLTYDGVAFGAAGRAFAVAPGDEEAQTRTTAHFQVAAGETATYTADDFTVYEQNAEGDYVESTRFDVTFYDASEVNSALVDDTYDTFVLTLLAGNALPSPTPTSTPEPINVWVEASGAVTTHFQVVTAEDTLQEYGLERDTLTGTVTLPGVTTLNDITVTMGRASYYHAFARYNALGAFNVELVSAATDDDDAVVSWTYELDHNGDGLNNALFDGLMSEIFALSGGGTTQHVAVNVQTLWNRYITTNSDGDRIFTDAVRSNNKDADNTVHGVLGRNDIVKGFDGDDNIFGFGGDDVLIGGAGNDDIHLGSANSGQKRDADGNLILDADGNSVPLGSDADGSSTVIYRFDSKDDTALAADGNDGLTGFELGIDRVMLIDIDETTPIVDVAGLIELAKTDALYVKLIASIGVSFSDPSDDVWSGIDFSFQQDATGDATSNRVSNRTLRINFHETITDAQATARFGGDATTAVGTYFLEREGVTDAARIGDLTDAGLDALETFFGTDTLFVVDTDLDLDIL